MRIRNSRLQSAALAMLVVTASCGELADPTSEPPVLASITGSLRLATSSSPPSGNIRLALIWHLAESDDSSDRCPGPSDDFNVSRSFGVPSDQLERRLLLGSVQQAVAITPHFPAAFQLDLTELPPPEAIWVEDDGGRKAEGFLVAYRDGNANGRLDPHPQGAQSPDEVLSNDLERFYGLANRDPNVTKQTWGYEVWYLDRDRSYSELLQLKRGFNVLEYQSYGARVADEVELELFHTAELQTQLCSEECLAVKSLDCPESPADIPLPPASAVAGFSQSGTAWVWENGRGGFGYQSRACLTGGGKYTLMVTRTVAGGCVERESSDCFYGPFDAPPADWPCTEYLDLSTRTYYPKP